jgi:hypothetical protein
MPSLSPSCRNPLEVTEEFIQQFNEAQTFEEKNQCEETARKMLERAKVFTIY